MEKFVSPIISSVSVVSLLAVSTLAPLSRDSATPVSLTPSSDAISLRVDEWESCVKNPKVVTVLPGQSLQTFINDAKPGTVIKVMPGRYEGCLDLGGIHGTDKDPIILVSETKGAAELIGDSNCAVITAGSSKGGVSNVGIYGFTIIANTEKGDLGGIKIAGPWTNPAHNIAVVRNVITGHGQDGVKFFNGARDFIVAGNTISGSWRQEALDNVSVERAVFAFNSTSNAQARYTSITMKGASRNIEVYRNDFDVKPNSTFRPVQVAIGGYGSGQRKRPPYWTQRFQADKVIVHNNTIGGPKSIVFAAGINSKVQDNSLRGSISYSCGRGVPLPPICSTPKNNVVGTNRGPDGPVGSSALPAKAKICPDKATL